LLLKRGGALASLFLHLALNLNPFRGKLTS
jgi:hypothetical protein